MPARRCVSTVRWPSSSGPDVDEAPAAALASWAAALFAVDPAGTGVWLRGAAGPARDAWLKTVTSLLPVGTPLRRLPVSVDDTRLLGGLDLGATLRSGRPVAQPGLLAEAHGGIVVLTMAERIERATAARLAAVLDSGEVIMQRDGFSRTQPARLGMVAFDEGIDDEQPPATLLDRLAIALRLDERAAADEIATDWTMQDIAAARALLPEVQADDDIVHALCAAALQLGVVSLRLARFALRVAQVAAALAGRTRVVAEDAQLAAQLVFAARATRLPAAEEPEQAEDEQTPDPPPEPPGESNDGEPQELRDEPLDDVVLEAARAAIPAGLLAALALGGAPRGGAGRAGAVMQHQLRGRPIGARRGEPRGGARLDLLSTLRTAAPWQMLRTRESPGGPRVKVRREDFHVKRFKQHGRTCTVFVVDASGSAALHRLAEAKGAVELLLAECYVRRDSVAVLAFRGAGAELLLPPTRSLVRAKRSLAGLPGGGGTPLAAGLLGAADLADTIRRHGETPLVVVLTDGRANIGLDGNPGRERAHQDALQSARRLRDGAVHAVLLDTAPQSQPLARDIAAAMGARYLALPHAGAASVAQAVRVSGGA